MNTRTLSPVAPTLRSGGHAPAVSLESLVVSAYSRGSVMKAEIEVTKALAKPRGRPIAPELFTASEFAHFCQVDLKTIHNWADKGEIRHFRTPGRHLDFGGSTSSIFCASSATRFPNRCGRASRRSWWSTRIPARSPRMRKRTLTALRGHYLPGSLRRAGRRRRRCSPMRW